MKTTTAPKHSGFVPLSVPALFEHQAKCVELSWDRAEFAIFAEQGTGKSRILLETARRLYQARKIDALIIINLKATMQPWITDEVEKWLRPVCDVGTAVYWKGKPIPVPKGRGLHVLSINYDALIHKKGFDAVEAWLKAMPCLIVADESTRIANYRAQRSKACQLLAARAPFRRIMTGTPVKQSHEDLYGQFKFLTRDPFGYETVTGFRVDFCLTERIYLAGSKRPVDVVIGSKNAPNLHRLVKPHSFRILKKDCLDLPEKLPATSWQFDLTKEQASLYQEIEAQLVRDEDETEEQKKRKAAYDEVVQQILDVIVEKGCTWPEACKMMKVDSSVLDFNAQTSTRALHSVLRLQQITCNIDPYDPAKRIVDPKKDPRLAALREYGEMYDGRLIVWARFRSDFEAIRNLSSNQWRNVYYYGAEHNTAQKAKIVAAWKQDKSGLFLANTRVAGLGLTLIESNNTLYYSNSWSSEDREQSSDRTHRIGQRNPCTYTDLEARIAGNPTVDARIVRALRKKQDVARKVLDEGGKRFCLGTVEEVSFEDAGGLGTDRVFNESGPTGFEHQVPRNQPRSMARVKRASA